MRSSRERLLGPAGERGDGDLGAEFGRGFVRGAEMPTSFRVTIRVRVSISTDPAGALKSACETPHKLCDQPLRSSGVEWPRAVFDSGQGRLQVGDGDAEVMLVSGDEADRLLGCTYEFQMRVTWTECRARRGVRRTQLLEVQASVWGADGGPGLDEIQGVVDLGARCCVLPSCR